MIVSSDLEEVVGMPLWVNTMADVDDMPLMPEVMRKCVAFLYRNRADALADNAFQSVAFFVNVSSVRQPVWGYSYLVTNEHVVSAMGKTFIARINTKAGSFKACTFPKDDFVMDKRYDIAAAPMRIIDTEMDYTYIGGDLMLENWKGDPYKLWIGPGDEVVMVSRIVGHKTRYKTANIPVMRFGNVSLCPQHEEKAFTVEMRSVAGHSGSPVFVYTLPFQMSGVRTLHPNFIRLLGINRGHLRHYEHVVSVADVNQGAADRKSPTHVVATNMAMSQVIPWWRISELLNCDQFQKQRSKADERFTGDITEDLEIIKRLVAEKSVGQQ